MPRTRSQPAASPATHVWRTACAATRMSKSEAVDITPVPVPTPTSGHPASSVAVRRSFKILMTHTDCADSRSTCRPHPVPVFQRRVVLLWFGSGFRRRVAPKLLQSHLGIIWRHSRTTRARHTDHRISCYNIHSDWHIFFVYFIKVLERFVSKHFF